MEESCDESESEIKVSENSGTYFSNESDIKTIDAVAAHELSYDSASLWEPLHVDVGNELVTESLQKKKDDCQQKFWNFLIFFSLSHCDM